MAYCGLVEYSVKFYREGLYKLIKFNSPRGLSVGKGREEARTYEEKLDASISRSRSTLLQLILCNDWQYFFTGTLNPAWWDRGDLFSFRNTFAQYIRDLRKQPGYKDLAYVLVPEKHLDGSWHLHGFLSGIPDSALSPFVSGIHPKKLVDAGYLNWGAYAKKFGFCSLGHIRNLDAAAFYVTKYVTKELETSISEIGGHTYFPSRGLHRALSYGRIYGVQPALDLFLTYDCRYCSTGWIKDAPWHFWFDYIEPGPSDVFSVDDPMVDEVLSSPDFVQCVIAGFPGLDDGGVV